MELSVMQRLKQIEDENRRLKQIVAEQTLDTRVSARVAASEGGADGSVAVGDDLEQPAAHYDPPNHVIEGATLRV